MSKFDVGKMMAGYNERKLPPKETGKTPVEKQVEKPKRITINQIPVSSIHECTDNMFSQDKDESYATLVQSIKTDGIHDALKVEIDADNDGQYILISGHRRFMAAKELRFEFVPCVVMNSMTNGQRTVQLVRENLGKRGPDPFGFAMATKKAVSSMETKSEIRKFLTQEIGLSDGGPTQRILDLLGYDFDFLQAGQNGYFTSSQVITLSNKFSSEEREQIVNSILELINNKDLSFEEKKDKIKSLINLKLARQSKVGRPKKEISSSEMVKKATKQMASIKKVLKKDPTLSNDAFISELKSLKTLVDELYLKYADADLSK